MRKTWFMKQDSRLKKLPHSHGPCAKDLRPQKCLDVVMLTSINNTKLPNANIPRTIQKMDDTCRLSGYISTEGGFGWLWQMPWLLVDFVDLALQMPWILVALGDLTFGFEPISWLSYTLWMPRLCPYHIEKKRLATESNPNLLNPGLQCYHYTRLIPDFWWKFLNHILMQVDRR